MPVGDLVALVLHSPTGSAAWRDAAGEVADWGPEQENTAQLLDETHALLRLQWTELTTDPNDAAVKRERAESKRAGRKPAATPPVPPVAWRPAGPARDAAWAAWMQWCTEAAGGDAQRDDAGPHLRLVSGAEAALWAAGN